MVEEKLKSLAAAVARRYAKKCWWADPDDLAQEAWVAMLEASRTWQEQVGVPKEAYLWKAAVYALRRYLWRNTSPANAKNHDFKALKTASKVSLDRLAESASTSRLDLSESPSKYNTREGSLAPEPRHDDCLAHQAWLAEIRDWILEEVEEIPDANLAIKVLLEGKKPREVAALCGVDVLRVYKAKFRAEQIIMRSKEIFLLWRER